MRNKILAGFSIIVLAITLFMVPQTSYADWGVGIRVGAPSPGPGFYRWHDHPRWGMHFHILPVGCVTVRVGWHNYYYYDGLYYNYVGGDYVLVSPPVGAFVAAIPEDFQPVLINGRTYYTDNGVYYILTRHRGYKVVAAPVVYAMAPAVVAAPVVVAAPAVAVGDSFPVNIPNNNGGYTTVVIKRSGNGYVGPQGEFYPQFPAVAQLKAMYGK